MSYTARGLAAEAEGIGNAVVRQTAAQGRFVTAGDVQEATYRMAVAMINTRPAELRIAGNGRQMVDAGRTLSCLVNIVPRSSTGESASFLRRVAVKNVAGVVSLASYVDTIGVDQKDAGAAAWAVAITADDANNARALTVTGAVGTAIRWHAVVQGSLVRAAGR